MRTNAAPHGGASSSARRRNPSQDVSENARLHLKRSRAVVLVVSRGHYDDEIEVRHDANGLPAPTGGGGPVDFTPIVQRAAEPPKIAIEIRSRGFQSRCHGDVDPCFRHDLTLVPAATREDKLADLRHVAPSQAQSPARVGISLHSSPLEIGNA